MSGGQSLTVELDRTDPVVVVAASGEMDASSVGRLDDCIERAVMQHEGHVVLDLTDVSFIDSTGITALISALRRLNRARRRLALAFTSDTPVARALELTGLDHTFECHSSADAAVSDLSDAPLIGR